MRTNFKILENTTSILMCKCFTIIKLFQTRFLNADSSIFGTQYHITMHSGIVLLLKYNHTEYNIHTQKFNNYKCDTY